MDNDSTFQDVREETTSKKPWARRIGTLALLVLVICGGTGVLGPRIHTVTDTAAGTTLTVDYARVARPGYDVPVLVTLDRPGGFTGSVDVAISAEYLAMFESQRFAPEPSDETREGDQLIFTFDTPDSDHFTFEFDAYLEPGWQRGKTGWISVLGPDGSAGATVDFHTSMIP